MCVCGGGGGGGLSRQTIISLHTQHTHTNTQPHTHTHTQVFGLSKARYEELYEKASKAEVKVYTHLRKNLLCT